MISVQPSFSSLPVLHSDPNWSSLPLFDREGWKRVRFGEVVQNCNETRRIVEAYRKFKGEPALHDAVAAWLESSRQVRESLQRLLTSADTK